MKKRVIWHYLTFFFFFFRKMQVQSIIKEIIQVEYFNFKKNQKKTIFLSLGGGQPSPNPPLRPHTRSWLLLCSHFSCEIINFMNWIPGKFTFFPALWGGGNKCYLPCFTCIKFNFTTLCSTLFWQCCEFDDTEYGRAKRRKSLSLSLRHVQVGLNVAF